jgi:hypothetical protein
MEGTHFDALADDQKFLNSVAVGGLPAKMEESFDEQGGVVMAGG